MKEISTADTIFISLPNQVDVLDDDFDADNWGNALVFYTKKQHIYLVIGKKNVEHVGIYTHEFSEAATFLILKRWRIRIKTDKDGVFDFTNNFVGLDESNENG